MSLIPSIRALLAPFLVIALPAVAAPPATFPAGTRYPVVQPGDWSPALAGGRVPPAFYSVVLAGMPAEYQGAARPYSITAPSAGTIRFELRDGDRHWWDERANHPVERCELTTRENVAAVSETVQVNFAMTVEPGQPNTAKWMVLGQLHQDVQTNIGGSPPVGIYMDGGERLSVQARWTDPATGKSVERVLWRDTTEIVRDKTYRWQIKAMMHPTAGHLDVRRNGKMLVSYAGPLGYIGMKGVYLALGIYRDGAAAETVAVRYGAVKRTVSPVALDP